MSYLHKGTLGKFTFKFWKTCFSVSYKEGSKEVIFPMFNGYYDLSTKEASEKAIEDFKRIYQSCLKVKKLKESSEEL